MKINFPNSILVVLGITILQKADSTETNIADAFSDYVDKWIEDYAKEASTEPVNKNNSIKYALFTPDNPKKPCFIEPTPEQFDNCAFNPSYEVKFLIHGFAVFLPPGNMLDDLKDALLDYENYNIIVVDWTLYNNFPFVKTVENIAIVGERVADLAHFITKRTGVGPERMHCIGHSFGAHVCGNAGRNIPNLKRISGLDPGPAFIVVFRANILLSYKDAIYVDIIHTSSFPTGTGLGLLIPIGHNDFYLNGGISQKHCKFGKTYQLFKGAFLQETTQLDKILCDHFIAVVYYTNSVRKGCDFPVTKCPNFLSAVLNPVIKLCPKNSSVVTKMGYFSEKIPGYPPLTSYYVDVLEDPPYCVVNKQR